MPLERIWAAWRANYVEQGPAGDDCVMCLIASDADSSVLVWKDELVFVVMNLYPYTSGHMMVIPVRHVADYEELTEAEREGIASATSQAISALKNAYGPDGINVGMNLGKAAGAGIPGHLHQHVLPRWAGDTNFTTTVAETRVLPEEVSASAERIRSAWAG